MPKVSIIVPVYNVEEFLRKCLDSLVNQTLQDIEIIAVNDGSTDESGSILIEYEKKYFPKIRVFEKENGGLSDARNYGMEFATGDYIAFLDSDDYVDVTIYEKLYNKAIKEKSDFVVCDFIWKYPNKEVIDKKPEYQDKHGMLAYGRVVAWNKLIKKELIEKSKIKFPKGLRYEDVEFFYKLLPYINKYSYVDEPLIYYIQRVNSIANTQNKHTSEIFDILKNVVDFYQKKDFYEEYKVELEYAYTRILLCSSFLRIVKIKDKDTRKKLLLDTWNNLNEIFPEWKKNKILINDDSKKGRYMKSINKFSFKMYSLIFRLKK